MRSLSDPLPWLLLSLAASLLATRGALAYSRARQLLDQPGERRSHVTPTPRGGGIGMVMVFVLALLFGWWQWPGSRPILSMLLPGMVMVAAIGWLDDHRPVSSIKRLAVHMLAAGLLAAGVLWQGSGIGMALLAFVLALGLVNAWNFMDGINGIAAAQAAVVALAVALLAAAPASLLALALVGACCGFLPFNAPRARIFMGDVGSGALGLALAGIVVLGAGRDWQLALLLAMPLGAFVVDTALTLTRRIMRRERWWEPHVQHLYQRMARKYGHMPVTAAYSAWGLLAVAAAVTIAGLAGNAVVIASAAWLVATMLLWAWLDARGRVVEG